MDVRDLAPALLAVGELLEETNRAINKDKATLQARVKSFRDGSFGIELQVCMSWLDQLNSFLARPEVASAKDLLEWLGIIGAVGTTTVGSLFGLLRLARGKKPRKVRRKNNQVIFEFEDGIEFETIEPVATLYTDVRVRKALRKTLEPLERDGVEALAVASPTDEKETTPLAGKEEVEFFDLPEVAPVDLGETEEIRFLSIVALSFKEDNKWRLTDGAQQFSVLISDKRFLDRVDRNQEAFAKGDLLKVRLRTTQAETLDGLKTAYEVVQVLEHRQAFQLSLPVDEES